MGGGGTNSKETVDRIGGSRGTGVPQQLYQLVRICYYWGGM